MSLTNAHLQIKYKLYKLIYFLKTNHLVICSRIELLS